MKVRIGNDIRLNLTLRGPKNYDQSNIKQLRCYLINTSVTEFDYAAGDCFGCGRCHKHHPHGHVCGHYGYHFPVHNACCHPKHKYPFSPCDPAMGEGPLRPNYGHPWHCDDHHNYDFKPFHSCYFRPDHHDFIKPFCDEQFKFLAHSKVLPGKNRIQTYFPAQDQLMCGDYKLVVVLVVYEAGWGHSDLHTYTIDYGTVVTLTDSSADINGSDIVIDVDNDSLVGNAVDSMKIYSNDLYMYPYDQLSIGDKDIYNHLYSIKVQLENGGVIEFDPNHWEGYDNLNFSSSNTGIVMVDQHSGKLVAKNIKNDTKVTITVASDGKTAEFNVTVIGSGTDYIGFYTNENKNSVRSVFENSTYFKKVDNIFDTHDLQSIENSYLWIISRKPIADSNSACKCKCSMFDVPLVYDGVIDGLYYYHCPNKLVAASFDITVEP